ncbi:UBX domain-containing protein 7-like [Limulus polyphemus]|uniref:UBX domain-containing protein 7-like n=1 Tax=Limulus polyphemus TaxID=6850 RepID=A0ABM1BVB0_LIMPO|nr:UBX domain-containing protein 7-like [Limulus polyphemus]
MAACSSVVSKDKDMKTLIEQFCAITDAGEPVAKQMLEACNGNLEMAVNMHVDTQASGCDIEETNSNPSTSQSENVRPPIPQTRGILVEDRFVYNFRPRRTHSLSVFDAFRDFQSEARIQEEQLTGTKYAQYNRKRKTLEDLFRPPLDLIHRGSFESARDMGKHTNRWLMVNIQDVQEFQCQVLNRDVWSSPAVKSIVSEHFIFWQVYLDSEEGSWYAQFYKVSQYPYVAILDPRTGENLVVWNKVDPISFCDLVTKFLCEYPTPDGSAPRPPIKKSKSDRILDQSEESQMKAAIQASLENISDVSILPEPEIGSEINDDSGIKTCDLHSESLLSENNKTTWNKKTSTVEPDDVKNFTCGSISKSDKEDTNHKLKKKMGEIEITDESDPLEQWKDFLGSGDDPESKIMLRFPTGERQQKQFPCSSQLQALVSYVAAQGFPRENYELVTNFPRRNLSDLKPSETLKDVGLFPRETVFIQLKTT